MAIAERFDRYVGLKARMDKLEVELKALKAEAEPDEAFITQWFRRHAPEGVRDWRSRGVIYHFRPGRRVMDQAAVRERLGDETPYKRSEPSETLELDVQVAKVRELKASA